MSDKPFDDDVSKPDYVTQIPLPPVRCMHVWEEGGDNQQVCWKCLSERCVCDHCDKHPHVRVPEGSLIVGVDDEDDHEYPSPEAVAAACLCKHCTCHFCDKRGMGDLA